MISTRISDWIAMIDARKVFLFAAVLGVLVLLYGVGLEVARETEPAGLPSPEPTVDQVSPLTPSWRQQVEVTINGNPFRSPTVQAWYEAYRQAREDVEPDPLEEEDPPPYINDQPEPEPPADPPEIRLHYHGMLTRIDGSVRALVSAPDLGWQRALRVADEVPPFQITDIHPREIHLKHGDTLHALPRGETRAFELP